MQKMAQGWFSGSSNGEDQQKPSSSLLADWNSYAASQDSEDGSDLGRGFDLEAAVRSANDTVSGTFNVVSKGVRDLPGNLQSATSSIPSGKALMYFGLLLATGVFFVFIAFTMFLPIMVLMPQKFAICFTLGCGFIIGSFFALRGPSNQLAHMSSKEYGGYHICLHGASQLHTLCAFLCDTGSRTPVLRNFILSWWICWDEISLICPYLFSNEMFWEVIQTFCFYGSRPVYVSPTWL
ncbi:uncharacterized protein LOC121237260 isoform X1 [Juglans microcarpa x Juglans regia]|uniref:uncharacterized protein LOC121237260 isoform X1 n=1 Tax=Juglans microcarpa x Juglans regia TaxID=2249226 RepID=UPI001B7EFF15|nr:uncharacterized protein LOC121237260 isoform X1 [Juglans microcarpa x Juglans regia]